MENVYAGKKRRRRRRRKRRRKTKSIETENTVGVEHATADDKKKPFDTFEVKSEKFLCPLCNEVFLEPCFLKGCEHMFCCDCLYNKWLVEGRKCPICSVDQEQAPIRCPATVTSILYEPLSNLGVSEERKKRMKKVNKVFELLEVVVKDLEAIPPKFDEEDNVYRCPTCLHELESRSCPCGYVVPISFSAPDFRVESDLGEDSELSEESDGSIECCGKCGSAVPGLRCRNCGQMLCLDDNAADEVEDGEDEYFDDPDLDDDDSIVAHSDDSSESETASSAPENMNSMSDSGGRQVGQRGDGIAWREEDDNRLLASNGALEVIRDIALKYNVSLIKCRSRLRFLRFKLMYVDHENDRRRESEEEYEDESSEASESGDDSSETGERKSKSGNRSKRFRLDSNSD